MTIENAMAQNGDERLWQQVEIRIDLIHWNVSQVRQVEIEINLLLKQFDRVRTCDCIVGMCILEMDESFRGAPPLPP
jgi:hypothetical protein